MVDHKLGGGDTSEVEEVDEAASPTTTTATSVKAGVTVGGVQIADEAQLPLVGGFGSAMVLLIALTVDDVVHDYLHYYEYGIALASITMILTFIAYFLCLKDDNENLAQIVTYNNYFLFLWGFIGACIMTFGNGPFPATGNGYFAAWGIAIFAIMGLGVNTETVKSNYGADMGLFAAAIIVMVAVSSEGFKEVDKQDEGEKIYALIVSIITLMVVMGFAMMTEAEDNNRRGEPNKLKIGVMALFAILWIVLACVVTFRGPFTHTGNGYFGAWGGAIASIYATFAAKGN